MTLLDEEKSVEQKTDETLMVASRWEDCPPIASNKNLHEVGVGGVSDVGVLKLLVFNVGGGCVWFKGWLCLVQGVAVFDSKGGCVYC